MAKLTETDIRQVASSSSFERGYSYYHNGYVSSVVQRGEQLTAEVEGSQYRPYQVQVTLKDGGVASAGCSCPYDWGDYCKHIVAVLLYYVHETADIETKPEVTDLLANLTEAQLRQLLINLTQAQPELLETIEREIGWMQQTPLKSTKTAGTKPVAVDIPAIRRELRKDLRSSGPSSRYDDYYYGDYYDEYFNPGEHLQPHMAKVAELLQAGDVASAEAVITAVIEEWIEGIGDFEDSYDFGDSLNEAEHELDQTLTEVILSLDLTDEEREEWIEQIEEWSDVVDLEIAETAVPQGWDYPPLVAVLQGTITDKGAWEDEAPWFADELAHIRLNILERQGRSQEFLYLAESEGQTERYIQMLARVGQTELAVTEAKRYLEYPNQILALGHILQEKGESTAALEIGEHGLTMPKQEYSHSKAPLAQWLRDLAEANHKPDLALQAAQVAFLESHTLEDYTTVQRLAGEQWPQLKEALLESLAAAHYSSRKVDIYLHEGMLTAAMRELDKNYSFYHSDLVRVVEATKEKYPDWGIQKYKNLGEAIMDAGRAKDYDTAANWLSRARDIYLLHNRKADWHNYLSSILDKHARKYKLVPMLRNIR